MSPLAIWLAVAALLAVGGVCWAVHTANSLICKRNRIGQCRSGIGIVVKQRNDLIPNLVASVKAYMGHESELLTRLAEIRSRSLREPAGENRTDDAEISALLARLNLAVESYPELKADGQFRSLQEQLVGMECELQAIRRTCNAAIVDYNNAIEMFPSSLIAAWRNHTPETLLVLPESELQELHVTDWFKK